MSSILETTADLEEINQGESTLEVEVFDNKFWEKVLNYFKCNGKLPNNITFDDLKKYNRENMIFMSDKSRFHKFLNTFFSDLKDSCEIGILKLPQFTSCSLSEFLTILLSFGLLPVFIPDNEDNAPELVILLLSSNFKACS